MYKKTEEIYPVTIVSDRYGGTYSGGQYTAWLCDPWDVPSEIDEGDVGCSQFWCNCKEIVGKGATPMLALEDLRTKLNEKLKYDTRTVHIVRNGPSC